MIVAERILADSFSRLAQGDPRGAEEVLAPLWNAGPKKPAKAMMLLGLIRRAQGRNAEAVKLLRAAAEAGPGDHETHHNLGHALLALGRPSEAEGAFREAMGIAPSFTAARIGLARALNASQRYVEAETEARACLQESRSLEALRALAHAVGGQGRHEEALALLEEVLAQAPGDVGARYDRAHALRGLKREDEAIATLEALVADGKGGANTIVALATALSDVGRAEEAEACLARGAAQHSEHVALQTELARQRWMRGVSAAEFALGMERAVIAAPENEAMRIGCAELLYRAGRADEGEGMVRDGLKRAPESPLLLGMLGFLQDERGASGEAVDAFRRALGSAPGAEMRQMLSHALLRGGDADAALREIRAGLEEAPHDQICLSYLSLALRMRGDVEFERLCDFDRFVRVIDIPPPEGLAERLDAMHVHTRHPLNQTLRNGTQTPHLLTDVDDPAVQAFLKAARDAVREFGASLARDETHPFASRRTDDAAFAGAWSVKLQPGGLHVNHVHHKGWVSSAYYVRLPSQAPEDDPHAGQLKFGEPRLPIGDCGPLKWVEPKVGRLVLFPSYFWHGTAPFVRGDRLTIAFDAVPA